MASRTSCLRLSRLASRRSSCHTRRSFASAASTDSVNVIEVGPRDGLQNEKNTIPLATKLELIHRLAATGLRTIEAASFVSPKWTPQMASSAEVLESLLQKQPEAPDSVLYQFLVPNKKGVENFLSVYHKTSSSHDPLTPPPSPTTDNGPALNTSSSDPNAMPYSSNPTDYIPSPGRSLSAPEVELSIFTAATESFTQKNTNCSIAESLERFKPIFTMGKDNNLRVRAYISVALGCPYEGPDIDPHKVAELAVSLLEMGADEISVADTTGMGTAPKTRELLKTLTAAGIETQDLALHFHDTYGQALVNTVVGLEAGVRTFDAAVAGLGGCPYSPGATGNVATEDLVYLFETLGLRTGVDLGMLAEVGEWISREVGRENASRAGKASLAQMRRRRAEA